MTTPKQAEEVLGQAEAHLDIEEASAEYFSELWQLSRQIQDELDEAYAPVKAKADKLVKPWAAVRSRAKKLVDRTKSALSNAYAAEDDYIQKATEEALLNGDQATLDSLPDTPPLAEGVTFAELSTAQVLDLSLVPREFLVPDTKAILKALKDGQDVPGCAIVKTRSWRRVAAEGTEAE